MATAKEIEKVFNLLCDEVNKTFIQKGVPFRTSEFDIEIVSERNMYGSGCDGLYIGSKNKIQIRRALFTGLVRMMKQHPNLDLNKIYYFNKLNETLVHEIGHAVHHKYFSTAAYELKITSSYGKKNHKERFAVAFQEYFTEDRVNNGMKQLLQNINKE